MKIVIIDYKMGNLGSIQNMLKKIGVASEISSDPHRIRDAAGLILPGVGAFDAGMDNLRRSGLIEVLDERVKVAGVPILGICLGMQLMTKNSAEGKHKGLGWIDAEALRFQPTNPELKVPHMGWNRVIPARTSELTDRLPEDPRFYFVHSYFVHCHDPADVLLTTPYGGEFHSAFHRGNIWGVQFHPEKSHRFGMALLQNFATKVH